jgi:hypothetical protein
MLSCFRTIVHQTGSFRPALRATTTAFFSTSRARKDKPSGAFGPLLDLLEEEGNKKEDNEYDAKNFITEIKGTCFIISSLLAVLKLPYTKANNQSLDQTKSSYVSSFATR